VGASTVRSIPTGGATCVPAEVVWRSSGTDELHRLRQRRRMALVENQAAKRWPARVLA
jgi:hypothetical protein